MNKHKSVGTDPQMVVVVVIVRPVGSFHPHLRQLLLKLSQSEASELLSDLSPLFTSVHLIPMSQVLRRFQSDL